MTESYLDSLPSNVQAAIYDVYMRVGLRDKIVFLSRLQYGNDFSYKAMSDAAGVTFQRVQQMYDRMLSGVKRSRFLTHEVACSGYMI